MMTDEIPGVLAHECLLGTLRLLNFRPFVQSLAPYKSGTLPGLLPGRVHVPLQPPTVAPPRDVVLPARPAGRPGRSGALPDSGQARWARASPRTFPTPKSAPQDIGAIARSPE